MTAAIVRAQIQYAKTLAVSGDCDSAEAMLRQAWTSLTSFSQVLAARGQSPSAALRLHKLLAQAQKAVRTRCVGEGLVQPTYMPSRGGHPDLLQPSFSGPKTDRALKILHGVGIGAAVLGLGYGFWTLARD
jgi:hypothetical protein